MNMGFSHSFFGSRMAAGSFWGYRCRFTNALRELADEVSRRMPKPGDLSPGWRIHRSGLNASRDWSLVLDEKFFCQRAISECSGAVRIVFENGFAEAGRFAQAHRARNDRIVNALTKMLANFGDDLAA